MLRYFIQFTVISISFTAPFTSCTRADGKSTEAAIEFPVTSPLRTDTIAMKSYAAEMQAVRKVEIRARVPGYLEGIHVDEGRHVREGQLLFTVSGDEYREKLAKAEALLQSAMATLDGARLSAQSVRRLQAKDVVSRQEVLVAENKVKSAQALVEEAKADHAQAALQLSYARITAPFSGVVNRIPFKKGSLIDAGSLLTSLSSVEEVFAYFHLSEKEYLEYRRENHPDEQVTLVLSSGDIFPHKGRIETTESEIDPETGTIAFRARFPNPEGLIRHGASGKVQLQHRLRNVILIPQQSTIELQDKTYVLAVGNDGRVHMREVKVAERIPHLFVIESGIRPGERIIYEGLQDLRDGDQVKTRFVPMSQVVAEFSRIKASD